MKEQGTYGNMMYVVCGSNSLRCVIRVRWGPKQSEARRGEARRDERGIM